MLSSNISTTIGGVINTSGSNLAIDSDAVFDATSGNNIAIGTGVLDETFANSDHNIAIGLNSMGGTWVNNLSSYNIGIGSESLSGAMDGTLGNTAVGRFSGRVATGDYNVFMGYDAGRTVAAGAQNVAIGAHAFDGATIGNDNVAIGKSAMGAIPAAEAVSNCTAIGAYALLGAAGTDTGIDKTVAIGHSALTALTTGTGNIAIGYEALKTASTDLYSTAVGYQALTLQLDGSGGAQSDGRNTAVGYLAGAAITSGGNNTAVGNQALRLISTHDSNVAIGSYCMDSGVANYCVAVGVNAMGDVLTADANGTVAIGNSALYKLTSGQYNTAVGYHAGYEITAADSCIAIGYNAMAVHTGGSDASGGSNIAIGTNAMDDNDQSDATLQSNYNIFIGTNSGGGTWTTTSSDGNTALGHFTLSGAMNGASYNTALGNSAGNDITTGSSNTFVGREAGDTVTTGTGNTYIGYSSGDTGQTGNYNTCLGYISDVSAAAGTNQTALGYAAGCQNNYETRIGNHGAVQFYSTVTSLPGGNDSTDTGAATTSNLFKIPASSIIKSVTIVVTELSNLAVHNFAVYLSTDTTRSLNEALTASGLVEILGAGASATTVSSLVASGGTDPDIVTGTDSPGVVNQTYRSTPDIAFGAAAKYVWIAAAGTGNTAATVSDPAIVRICVEFIGQD